MANETAAIPNVVGNTAPACRSVKKRILVAAFVTLLGGVAVAAAVWRDEVRSLLFMPMDERVQVVRQKHAAMSAVDLGISEPITNVIVGNLCGAIPQLTFTDADGKRFQAQYCEDHEKDGWSSLPPKNMVVFWRLFFGDYETDKAKFPRHRWHSETAKQFHGLLVRWAMAPENMRRLERILNADDRPDYEKKQVADWEQRWSDPKTATSDAYFDLQRQRIFLSMNRRGLPMEDSGFLKAYAFLYKLDWFCCSDGGRRFRNEIDEF